MTLLYNNYHGKAIEPFFSQHSTPAYSQTFVFLDETGTMGDKLLMAVMKEGHLNS